MASPSFRVLALLGCLSPVALAQGPAPGFTLIPPNGSPNTSVVDVSGATAHSWPSDTLPGLAAYLLDNGNLLRAEHPFGVSGPGGGAGGRVREIQWDGTVVWTLDYSAGGKIQHHDVEPLPNGNVLVIAWDQRTFSEAVAAGRNPTLTSSSFWSDHVIEYDPIADAVVWEWYVFDHLVQDFDATKANFAPVGDHPERVDVNFPPNQVDGDWTHINSVDYNAELDQILLSVHDHHEIWIIDHSTTTAEAAGHTGGNSGRGGDLLYRWGNPQAYRAGTGADQILQGQHDANWVEPGYPGEGNIVLFNNNHGGGGPFGGSSAVVELTPPAPDVDGNYPLAPGSAYGPAAPGWVYQAPNPTDLYTANQGGAVRLENGNTLITSTNQSWVFEVDPAGTIVWEHFAQAPFKTRRYDRPLLPNGQTIDMSSGGSVDLQIVAGSPFASQFFFVLGSTGGTEPGIDVNGQHLPLDIADFYFNLTLSSKAPLTPNLGVLDSLGRATSSFALNAAPALAGITIHHAAVVLNPTITEVLLATNAVRLDLVP